MKNINCLLHLHKYKNKGLTHYKIVSKTEFPYVIGYYKFKCKKCNKVTERKFMFPYDIGTVTTLDDAIEQAKEFKDLK